MRAAEAAAAACLGPGLPDVHRGHLVRGRIRLALARQYLGLGAVVRTGHADRPAAVAAARGAVADLLAAVGGTRDAGERCRGWLDVAVAVETVRAAGGAEPGTGGGGAVPDVGEAVDRALEAAGDDEELCLECRLRAGRLHGDLFAAGHRAVDLDRAVDAWRAAGTLLAPDDPRRPAVLTDYGTALVSRGERRGDAGDVDAAVRLLHRAVCDTSGDDPELAERRRALGIAHYLRFRARRELADLHEAEWNLGEAARGARDAALAYDCWVQRAAVVVELAVCTGRPALLDQADSHLRRASAAAPPAVDTGQVDDLRAAVARLRRTALADRAP
jgi:hypothetical protein